MGFTFDSVRLLPDAPNLQVNIVKHDCRIRCDDKEYADRVQQEIQNWNNGGGLTSAIIVQDGMSFLNLVIQLACIHYIFSKKYFKKSTFFSILFILSITISFRVVFYIIAITFTAIRSDSISTILTRSSLYIDYCSNFFSLSITFLMSLNRCLCFLSKSWNEKLFEGKNVVFPIVGSTVVSITGAVLCIITSEVSRIFLPGLGFVDMGKNTGFKVLINRIFFVFPFGSIACYIALFYVIRQQNKMVLTRTSNRNRGENKVFVQLLITTVLYGIMSILYEILNFVDWYDISLQMTFISVFNVLNYLPEMSLPLLLICNSVQIRKKISQWIAPKSERTVVTEHGRATTTANES